MLLAARRFRSMASPNSVAGKRNRLRFSVFLFLFDFSLSLTFSDHYKSKVTFQFFKNWNVTGMRQTLDFPRFFPQNSKIPKFQKNIYPLFILHGIPQRGP